MGEGLLGIILIVGIITISAFLAMGFKKQPPKPQQKSEEPYHPVETVSYVHYSRPESPKVKEMVNANAQSLRLNLMAQKAFREMADTARKHQGFVSPGTDRDYDR